MKKLKKNYHLLKLIVVKLLIILCFAKPLFSNELKFEIRGNNYTDFEVILSLLENIPDEVDPQFSNDIIKTLNNSNLFSDIQVTISDNKYIIEVKEFPNINKIYFRNNQRIKDEELTLLISEVGLINFNQYSINLFIKEIENLYSSFGYNDLKINYNINEDLVSNTVDIYFEFEEGKITKINQIFFNGNDFASTQELKQIINSKTKSIRNIFANNNFKPVVTERDKFLISNFYKNNGYLDIKIETKIEFLNSNKVNIYFDINEGSIYLLDNITISDEKKLLNSTTLNIINSEILNYSNKNNFYSFEEIDKIKNNISSIIINNQIEFFEINSLEKVNNNKIDILFQILPIKPKYTNQINIVGNYRTSDYVIRRELEIVEGDAFYDNQVDKIRNKLISLNLFENINIKEEKVDNNKVNLIIEVEEKQTGTFNAGVSIGTLDGFSIVTGLRERNFYGTGRSLEVLLNTSEDKNEFKLITTDRLSFTNDADISYKINYKQQDFSTVSSYKLDTFSSGIGIGYKVNNNLYHNINFEYALKDYHITNASTASNSILNSSGENVSYLITNNFRYSTLNSGFLIKKGNYINFNNTFETPTSSNNGYIRNLLTFKQYYNRGENIFSIQTKIGNIFSLNNKDILTDDKFALGGRWLRGFDNYGAGPRNSRTSYVGGNNIAVTKLDYSYEITKNSDFPIFINIFNDYGLIWENKTTPTNTDNNLRSSAGFGIKYYSPIGPMGFTWGFPLIDEEYDIKRMFLFSIGNID